MYDRESALNAVKGLNGYVVDGTAIRVEIARNSNPQPREARSAVPVVRNDRSSRSGRNQVLSYPAVPPRGRGFSRRISQQNASSLQTQTERPIQQGGFRRTRYPATSTVSQTVYTTSTSRRPLSQQATQPVVPRIPNARRGGRRGRASRRSGAVVPQQPMMNTMQQYYPYGSMGMPGMMMPYNNNFRRNQFPVMTPEMSIMMLPQLEYLVDSIRKLQKDTKDDNKSSSSSTSSSSSNAKARSKKEKKADIKQAKSNDSNNEKPKPARPQRRYPRRSYGMRFRRRFDPNAPTSQTIVHVARIPPTMKEDEFKEAFKDINIKSVTLPKSKFNINNNAGFGFIEFDTPEDQKKFLDEHKQIEVGGRMCTTHPALDMDKINEQREKRRAENEYKEEKTEGDAANEHNEDAPPS